MRALLDSLALVFTRLPESVLARVGSLLGWIAGSIVRIRRSAVIAAMERANIPRAADAADAMYRQLGLGLAHLFALSRADGSQLRERLCERVTLDDAALESMRRALEHGPVVLFGSHTGHWELSAARAALELSSLGRKLWIVAKPMSDPSVDAFLQQLRSRIGVRVLPPQGALFAAAEKLAAGDVVVLPIDQVPERAKHSVEVSFLGALALVDRAPATVAWRARATTLVVASSLWGDRQRVELVAEIQPPTADADARGWIDEVTRTATEHLEAFIRSRPSSWLWLHRRWRLPRPQRPSPMHERRVKGAV